MPGHIHSRFKALLAEKEMRDGKRYTYQEISAKTGLATSTLTSYANDYDLKSKRKITAYKKNTLMQLCDFFECEVKDLITYRRD